MDWLQQLVDGVLQGLLRTFTFGMSDLVTSSQNATWAFIRSAIDAGAQWMPLPVSTFAVDQQYSTAFTLYIHGLTWLMLFSYFINMQLLFNMVLIILGLEGAVFIPRWWIFIKRLFPFL